MFTEMTAAVNLDFHSVSMRMKAPLRNDPTYEVRQTLVVFESELIIQGDLVAQLRNIARPDRILLCG